ncbi:MAG: hypothetical protein R6X14_01595 [bacterium]
MKVVRLAVLFALVAGVFCGGQEQTESTTAQAAGEAFGAMPGVAFAELTQAEMDRLVGALPDVVAALKAGGYETAEEEGDEIPDALARTVSGMRDVPGVGEALKKSGTNWDEFSGTMYKVMAASTAIGLEMALAMAEGMVDETEDGKKMKAELEKARAFCERVPQGNREMVIQNMERLEPLGDLN